MVRTGFTLKNIGSLTLGEVDGRTVEFDEDLIDAFLHEGGVGSLTSTKVGRVYAVSLASVG